MNATAFHPFRSVAHKAEYQARYEVRGRAWPVACETRLIDTPSGQTFVRITGSPTQPPLILLHGARGNSLMWIPNIAALSAHYRTYAIDTIGETGLSVSRRRLTKPEQMVTWLHEVLGALVPEGAVSLVGMSYGGWLASQYALRCPARVRKVVLLAPAATVLPVSMALIVRALLVLVPGFDFRRKFYHWLLNDTVQSGAAGRAQIDEYVDDWALAERCFKELLIVPATVIGDKEWGELKVPTLFLVGENEKLYPAHKAIERLKRVAPQIKTAMISGAGHDLWLVRAEVVTRAIVSFLRERSE